MEVTKKRGRPVGSTNKPKAGANIQALFFEKEVEGSAICKPNPLGWVNWGQKNNYPLLLLDLYAQSPTHSAAINFGVQSICGNGIDYDAMQLDGSQVVPNYYESWDDLIRNIALDFMLYGSYAVQIIKNNDNSTYSFFHIPLEKVRWEKYDEDGQIMHYYICNDWTKVSQNPPIIVDAFDMRSDAVIERGKPYLYVYKRYSPTMTYYTAPHYVSAIKAIQSEIEYLNFDLKSTVNGFTPSGMIVLNEVETDEERNAIISNITSMFQGTDNANSVMVTFRNNQDEQPPQFVPFSANNGNINLFDAANERTINRILTSHQIPASTLIGIPETKSGFSSEGDMLETAYQVYNRLTGNSNRMAVIRTLNNMLKMNGIDVEIIMKPLSFNDFGNDADVAERTQPVADVTEGVDEEKVENNDNNSVQP